MRDSEKFNEWMKTKVQSIYYADNEKMLKAFNKIAENEKV